MTITHRQPGELRQVTPRSLQHMIMPTLTASWEGDRFHHLILWKRKLKQRERKGLFLKAKAKIRVRARLQFKG